MHTSLLPVFFPLLLRGCLLLLLGCCLTLQAIGQGVERQKLDSLLARLPQAQTPDERLQLLEALTSYYYDVNFDSARYYALRGFPLARQTEKHKLAANLYNNAGNTYDYLQKPDSALLLYERAIERFKQAGDTIGIARAHGNMGLIYKQLGNWSLGLQHVQAATRFFEEAGNERAAVIGYVNTSSFYLQRNLYDLALEQNLKVLNSHAANDYFRSYALAEIIQIYMNAGDSAKTQEYLTKLRRLPVDSMVTNAQDMYYSVLARYYVDFDLNLDSVKKYANIALQLAEQTGNINDQLLIYGYLGIAHQGSRKFNRAEQYYRKALALAERHQIKANQAANQYYLASLAFARDNYAAAIRQFEAVLPRLKQLEETTLLEGALRELHQCHAANGQFRQALATQKSYWAIKRQIRESLRKEKLLSLETRFELERRKELRRSLREARARQLQADNTRQLGWTTTLVIVGLAFLGFFGKNYLPAPVLKTLIFFALLMLMESVLVYLDPWFERQVQGLPVLKLLFNTAMALVFMGLHEGFSRGLLRKKPGKAT